MDRFGLQTWLDRYVEAWRANTPDAIEVLFSEDAVYRFHPYDAEAESAVGRSAIVESWLEEPDDPSSWDAQYEAFAIDGDRAVAIGTSVYHAATDQRERFYYNCFLLRFDADDRCVEFTEYYVRRPD